MCGICEEIITQAYPRTFIQKALQNRLELDLEAWVDRKGRILFTVRTM